VKNSVFCLCVRLKPVSSLSVVVYSKIDAEYAAVLLSGIVLAVKEIPPITTHFSTPWSVCLTRSCTSLNS